MSRLAVIGTGVIGNGWIARALAQGWDVVSFDPDPKAPARTQAFIDNAWPSLTQLGLAPDANPERLTFADTIEKAVDGADLIQENVPERLPLKQEILATIWARDRRSPLQPGVFTALGRAGWRRDHPIHADRQRPKAVSGPRHAPTGGSP